VAEGEGPAGGFVPPPYPYDRLTPLKAAAEAHEGGMVDLSIGTPCDPPPHAVVEALARSDSERGYPPSLGTPVLREEIAGWFERRLAVRVDPATQVAACVGTKELVGLLPHLLHLRDPSRDTVLYPEISYPTYAMGATLAGCRAVPVPVDERWCLDLTAIDPADAERALCLWVNTPGNPAGGLDDLGAVATWGRANDVLVASDECYVEFTWQGEPVAPGSAPGRSILEHGTEGLLAVHSLSKRSNLAGLRVGFYAGQTDLVHYLAEVRKHLGLMVPGPAQAAGAVALQDDEHVVLQRERYAGRLAELAEVLRSQGSEVALPGGAFYLWAPAPGGDAWGFAARLAEHLGMLVSPGDLYGPAGAGHVRVAAVQPDERIALLSRRAAPT
jgi:succinyldiaminopimelate transaminase